MSLGFDRDFLYERRLRENDPIQQFNKSIQTPEPHGNSKTYCMDFDGVLHYHETGSGPGPLTEPLNPGIAMAKRIKAAGHKLVVLTARPQEQHDDIMGWLKGHGVKADEVTSVKPPAEAYIDDRAVPWPRNARESLHEAIESFGKPLREGGSGSGNFGHQGRPGEIGGAGPGGVEKKERKRWKIGEKYGLAGQVKGGFKVAMAKEMFGKHYKELERHEKNQVKAALRNRGFIRPQGSTEASAGEKELMSAKVLKMEHLGGGINNTQLITLEGGIKAVFKQESKGRARGNITPGKDGEREVAAWQVAKVVGLEDIVPPTVIRTIDGARGSVMKFWDGELAANVGNREAYDGNQDLHRAAMFDYVIGNTDRHRGNWLVGNGKLQLIDHGLSFPEDKNLNFYNAKLMGEVGMRQYGRPAADTPEMDKLGKPYIDNKDKILDALKRTGLPQSAIDATAYRIDRIGRKASWKELLRS